MNAQEEISREFERGKQARVRGNEGQARVCARRAAGIAVREYLIRRGIRPLSTSAMDLLTLLQDQPDLPPHLKLITGHLTLRVTEEFKLPVEADLMAEAQDLCEWLLKT